MTDLFPNEIWSIIIPYVDSKTIKNVRLINSITERYFQDLYSFRVTEELLSKREGLEIILEKSRITREIIEKYRYIENLDMLIEYCEPFNYWELKFDRERAYKYLVFIACEKYDKFFCLDKLIEILEHDISHFGGFYNRTISNYYCIFNRYELNIGTRIVEYYLINGKIINFWLNKYLFEGNLVDSEYFYTNYWDNDLIYQYDAYFFEDDIKEWLLLTQYQKNWTFNHELYNVYIRPTYSINHQYRQIDAFIHWLNDNNKTIEEIPYITTKKIPFFITKDKKWWKSFHRREYGIGPYKFYKSHGRYRSKTKSSRSTIDHHLCRQGLSLNDLRNIDISNIFLENSPID